MSERKKEPLPIALIQTGIELFLLVQEESWERPYSSNGDAFKYG